MTRLPERLNATALRCPRDIAVTEVDAAHGYTVEFAADEAAHVCEYDTLDEELRDELAHRWNSHKDLVQTVRELLAEKRGSQSVALRKRAMEVLMREANR